MLGRVVKWGNSLGIRIPKPLAAEAGVDEGSTVNIGLKDGALVIEPVAERPSLKQLVASIRPSNRHTETETGGPVGNEAL